MIATVLISLLIVMLCAIIIVGMVKDKKSGHCSCECGNCTMSDICKKIQN